MKRTSIITMVIFLSSIFVLTEGRAAAQYAYSLSAVSENPEFGIVEGYSYIELDYEAWLYYDGYIDGSLFQDGVQVYYASDQTDDNYLYAEVASESDINPGSDYSVTTDNFLFPFFDFEVGAYADPYGFYVYAFGGPYYGIEYLYEGDPNDGTYLADYYIPLGYTGVTLVQPAITSLNPDRAVVGRTLSVTIAGKGFAAGATVRIAGTGVTASNIVVNSATQITANFAIAADAAGGNHAVTVAVGSAISNGVNFYVQIPTRLARFDYRPAPPARQAPNGISQLYVITDGDVLDLSGNVVASHRCGAYRNLIYRLFDQDGNPIIPGSDLSLTETFPADGYSGPPGFKPNDITSVVSEDGVAEDLNAIVTPAGSCLTADPNVSETQKFFITIGSKVYNLTTTVNIRFRYDPATNTYTVNNTITTP